MSLLYVDQKIIDSNLANYTVRHHAVLYVNNVFYLYHAMTRQDQARYFYIHTTYTN